MDVCRRCCSYLPEVLLVVGVAAFITAGAALSSTGSRELDPQGHLLLVIASVALLGRRRCPLLALTVSALAVLWYQAHGYPSLITTLPVLIAVYSAVSAGRRRSTVAVVAATLALTSFVVTRMPGVHRPIGELTETKLVLVGWLLAGGVMAEMSRHRRAYIEEVEQRAIEAERTREETARRRATEERLRIARDLHDSLTHSISIIKVQAGVAIHLARKNHEEVPASLLAIDEASADAVRELRSALGALRQPWGDDDTDGVGLHRVPALVERTNSAGIPTTVSISTEPTGAAHGGGDSPALPAAVDEAAYRIVQEALTNVTRHAGPASADVRIEQRDGELHISVVDDGVGAPSDRPLPGVGLIGMRERVHALGGHLRAEPRPDRGFSVSAVLPIPRPTAPAAAAPAATAPAATAPAATAPVATTAEPAGAASGTHVPASVRIATAAG